MPSFHRADEDRESKFGKVYSVSGPVVIAENMVCPQLGNCTIFSNGACSNDTPSLQQIGAAMYELVSVSVSSAKAITALD